MELTKLVTDFALALSTVDSRRPQASNQRSGELYQVGIGPHTESQTVALVSSELASIDASAYSSYGLSVPYPAAPKQKCDLCFGDAPTWDWAIEVKMVRMLGDNGKPNDNLPTHILSPYPAHRSALTDCQKLLESNLGHRRAILIYGYEASDYPVASLIEAFEALASSRFQLGDRAEARFAGLVHPVHEAGVVSAWELLT